MNRRNLLKLSVLAGGAAAIAAPTGAKATTLNKVSPEAVGMLYDSTRCIGCKACVVACREANELPTAQTEADGGRHDMQQELNGNTKNVIKLYRDEANPSTFAFMKQQCMHCIDPSCASVCMLTALKKDETTGIITYDPNGCIGCRYCQIACPYNVPKFEWAKATPKIVKCELCRHLLAKGEKPGCCRVCPRAAVIYGKYEDLKKEAHARVAAEPKRYSPKIFGETDGGGTQVLYLTSPSVSFEKLGLPDLGEASPAYASEKLQAGIYQGFATPAILFVGLAGAVLKNWKSVNAPDDEASHGHPDSEKKP
jgi:Fe-S-cluster-containing dehydrogenase component